MGAVRILFADHVCMCLEDHRAVVLIARRRRLIDHHIADGISFIVQASGPGKVLQVVGYPFLLKGSPGDPGEFLKIFLMQLFMIQYIHMVSPFRLHGFLKDLEDLILRQLRIRSLHTGCGLFCHDLQIFFVDPHLGQP